MSSYNPINNIKNYVSGSHRFINAGTGSGATPTDTLVTLEKRTVMTIESCNIGIGTTIPRTALDIIGNAYISQNLGIGTTIIGAYALNVAGNIYSSGTITSTNYIGGSATLSGTLLTSNLTVLGSNTVNNTYTQQSSNFSICNVSGTGPALSVTQKGIGAGYPIADFYDLDIFPPIPSLRIADGGNVGIGTTIPLANLHVQGKVYTSANIGIGTTIIRNKIDIIGDIITTGNIGIGTTLPRARLQVGAGTTTIAPFRFTSGTNSTAVNTGAIEYDGKVFYGTADATSGRGYIPNNYKFCLLTANAPGFSTITNMFGTTSSINLIAGGIYKLEANMYIAKNSSGAATLRITLTTTQNVVNLNGFVNYSITTDATTNRISLFKSATTANAFGVSASLAASTNHGIVLHAIIEANASLNSTLTINGTSSSSGFTLLRGSYYKVSQLPSGNTGIFS